MRPSDVPPHMSGMEEWFDGAIDGRPCEAQDVGGLSSFVEDIRAAFPEEPLLAEEAHIEAVLDAARRIPAAGRDGPDRKEERVRVPRFRLGTLRAKVAAASVVVVAMFGGLATAGALTGGEDGIVEAPQTQGTEELVAEFEDLDDALADVANEAEDEPDDADEADEADERADAEEAEDESDDQDDANDEAEDESDDDANEDESDDDSDDDSDDNTSDDEEDDDSEDGGSDD